jgi:hypothetical protein
MIGRLDIKEKLSEYSTHWENYTLSIYRITNLYNTFTNLI